MTDERDMDNRPGPSALMAVKVALRLEGGELRPDEPLVVLYYRRGETRQARVRRVSDGAEFWVSVYALKYWRP